MHRPATPPLGFCHLHVHNLLQVRALDVREDDFRILLDLARRLPGLEFLGAELDQVGTPCDTNTAPSPTNQGTAQPADTNPSMERLTGTAGSPAEQARSGAQGVTATQLAPIRFI